jgi:endonuclease/exonuclease/phosphatase family metal-dependent hydrolase
VPQGPNTDLGSIFSDLDFDLLGVQEVDENQPRTDGARQVEAIAQASGAKDWAYARTLIGTPGGVWRKPVENEAELQSSQSSPSYGIGMISKLPVKKWHRLELGKDWIGMPLAVGGKKGMRLLYIRDEPRVCIIAELENGFTVATTHLSFVPFVNLYQLGKVKQWAKKLSEEGKYKVLIIGDLNLPKNFSGWNSLITQKSYPSWGAKVQFDYILSNTLDANQIEVLPTSVTGVSDHLPVSIRINA